FFDDHIPTVMRELAEQTLAFAGAVPDSHSAKAARPLSGRWDKVIDDLPEGTPRQVVMLGTAFAEFVGELRRTSRKNSPASTLPMVCDSPFWVPMPGADLGVGMVHTQNTDAVGQVLFCQNDRLGVQALVWQS